MSTSELIKAIEDYGKIVTATDPVITQIPKSYVIELINEALKGKVIVPVNPTEAMVNAAVEWFEIDKRDVAIEDFSKGCYKSMIDTINNEGESNG